MRWVWRVAVFLLALAIVGIAAFFTLGPGIADARMNPVTPHAEWPVSAEAEALHDTLVVGDWHADTMLWNRDILSATGRGHLDLPRLQEGNVAVQVFTAVTKSPRGLNYGENAADAPDDVTLLAIGQLWPVATWDSLLERALWQAEKLRRFAASSDGQLIVIDNQAELDAILDAREAGAPIVGGLLGIEGAHPLEGDLANLDRLEAAGYRLIGLQHFFDNEAGGSLHGEGASGLTDFGRALVAEVEARGMILDLAHSSPAVVEDVLAMTDMPVVLSHGGIASHCASLRNIDDALMQRIAESGGVAGIGFWADVTCDDSPAGVAAAIVAAVEVMGADHVSLGSDYDGTVRVAFDSSELAALTHALLEAGLDETTVAKVMGGNMVRVLRDRLD